MTEITAKQEPTPKKKGPSKACRYFKKGFCGYGEKCSYKHTNPKSRSDVENCRFYKKASCKFASKCWNKHIPPNGKVYPKPGPLNKFIVVGPSGEEPDKIEESTDILEQETEIRRSFKRPENQDQVSKKCFYFEKKGTCCYGDKCWYSHSEPHALPADELIHEETPGPELEQESDPDYTKMCYNFIFTECEFGDDCPYVHGDICQFCDLPFLHPFDEKQRNEHLEACEIFFLEDMDIAFKIMNSKDKMCAVCLEYVWALEKPFTKQKFGIQEKCNHIFCLRCIRKWRAVKLKERHPLDCPECRTESDFLVPSACWFENNKEKLQWVEDYKTAIARKPCKFYAKGNCKREGDCKYNHSGFELPTELKYQMQGGGSDWGSSESNNLATNGVAANRDQQDAGWLDLPEQQQDLGSQDRPEQQQDLGSQDHSVQEFWDDTPLVDQTNVDLQSGNQVASSNLTTEPRLDGSLGQVNVVDGDEQNVQRQVLSDQDIWGDTQENEPNKDLLLQSSENISSETTAQQFDDNLEQADSVNVEDQQDEENQDVEQDPEVSLDTP